MLISICVLSVCSESTAAGVNKLEEKIRNLEGEIKDLSRQVDQTEDVVGNLLAYGTIDEARYTKYLRPNMALNKRIKALEVNNTIPGIFEFTISPELKAQPVIFITTLEAWGDMPVKNVAAQVYDVSKTGFKVSISNQIKHLNCGFSYLILSGDELH